MAHLGSFFSFQATGDFVQGLQPYLPFLVGGAVTAIIALSLISFFVSRYKRCPSNKVLVVYGRVAKNQAGETQAAEVYSGGGAFIWPVIQEHAFLDLTPHQIDIQLSDALSLENIRVQVPSVVTVAIGDTRDYQMNAATRMLNLSEREVQELAANIIFGQMRQVIASMSIESINRDRESFRKHIEEAIEPELKKIGLKLINVNIKDVNDSSGFIESIGRKAGTAAKQQADADVADEERKGQTAVANAERERDIAVAQANRDRKIGVADAEREQAIQIADLSRQKDVAERRAEFERDTEIANADKVRRTAVASANADAVVAERRAEYERDREIADADQVRRTAVAKANAEAVEGESLSKAREAGARAGLGVKEAEAFQQSETARKTAEAAVQEAANQAQAKAEDARARLVEATKRAELEAPAKAEKAQRLVQAEAAAEARRLEAKGQADALFAMKQAEARGELEMLSRKAEGLKAIVDACGGADEAYRLLMLEHIDHMADTAADAIRNIKFDKVTLWGGVGGNGGAGAGVSSFITDLMAAVPPALQTMLDIGGVKFSDKLVEIVPDAESPTGVALAGNGGKGPAVADGSTAGDGAGPSEEARA